MSAVILIVLVPCTFCSTVGGRAAACAHKGIAELSHELAAAVAPHLCGVDGAAAAFTVGDDAPSGCW